MNWNWYQVPILYCIGSVCMNSQYWSTHVHGIYLSCVWSRVVHVRRQLAFGCIYQFVLQIYVVAEYCPVQKLYLHFYVLLVYPFEKSISDILVNYDIIGTLSILKYILWCVVVSKVLTVLSFYIVWKLMNYTIKL